MGFRRIEGTPLCVREPQAIEYVACNPLGRYPMLMRMVIVLMGSFVLAVGLTSCMNAPLSTPTPDPVRITATAQTRHNEAETRIAGQSATRTAHRTVSAALTVTAESLTPTRSPANTSTPKPRAVMDRNLIIDVDNIGYAADALLPVLQRCIQRGDLNWDNHSRFFDDLMRNMDAIARDVQDGYLDDHSVSEVRSLVSSAMNKFDQLERQCLR